MKIVSANDRSLFRGSKRPFLFERQGLAHCSALGIAEQRELSGTSNG